VLPWRAFFPLTLPCSGIAVGYLAFCEVCVEEAGAFEVGLPQQRTQIQEK